jgi:hypothetical protein
MPLGTLHRAIFSNVPSTKVRVIVAMLKAIHAGEVRVIEKMRLRLANAAELVATAIEETLGGYYEWGAVQPKPMCETFWTLRRSRHVFQRAFRSRRAASSRRAGIFLASR